MDNIQYKDYVLFMLFIKYISDKYAESDDFASPVTILPGAAFKDMVNLKGKNDIGNKFNIQIIQPLIDNNSRLARSHFPGFNNPNNAVASTMAYDPICGSGSLLLKGAGEAGKHITLEEQEKDVTTAGLARMNTILHDFSTANILNYNTLASPKFTDGENLRTYDFLIANPTFSDKMWSKQLRVIECCRNFRDVKNFDSTSR